MTDDTDTPDGLAAEYVLGTLGADERAQAEALIGNDPAFARLVRRWERRLGELHAMMHSVEPPPDTWARIQARIDGGEPRAATLAQPDQAVVAAPERNVVALSARLQRWRQVAAGLGALAAVLVALVAIQALNPAALPGLLRPKPIEIVKTETPANPGRFVAVLQQNAAAPAFILTVDVATRTASVRRVSAEQPAGKSYELWLVSDRFPAPRSLGLVGASEFARPALASYDPATVSGATYAVSLEPEGGSPTGAPTGPILFTGKLVESVPPSP
jgi:anti-sigma-K factor RskA